MWPDLILQAFEYEQRLVTIKSPEIDLEFCTANCKSDSDSTLNYAFAGLLTLA